MPRLGRGRATRSTRSPATFALDGHLIETYNHIDDLPRLSSLPRKRPRHATRGATAAERRDRQHPHLVANGPAPAPAPRPMATRSSRHNLPAGTASPSPPPHAPASEDACHVRAAVPCRVCLRSTTSRKIIRCSICRKGIHTFCLNPPVMDLPTDPSWKCIKCRNTRLPLKKEARIILRDALTTYPRLCTHKYVSSVAEAVCVISDSESTNPKRNGKPYKKLPGAAHQPSALGAYDNTVILRVETTDSELDSDVDDPLILDPLINPGKPPPSSQPRPLDRDRHSDPVKETESASHQPPSLPLRPRGASESLSSAPSSIDMDDERPLSELIARNGARRSRLRRVSKLKDLEHAHASPKMKLKARQRRLREAKQEDMPLSLPEPKALRDPRTLPLKRRGRKPSLRRKNPEALEGAHMRGADDRTHQPAKATDEAATSANGGARDAAASASRNQPNKTANTTNPSQKSAEKQDPESQGSGASGHVHGRLPDPTNESYIQITSASEDGDESSADVSEDLPLAKRSLPRRDTMENKVPEASTRATGATATPKREGGNQSEEGEKRRPMETLKRQDKLPDGGGKMNAHPASDAPVSRATGDSVAKQGTGEKRQTGTVSIPAKKDGQEDAGSEGAASNLHTPSRNPSGGAGNVASASHRWAEMELDPKREALLTLAMGQKLRPKPGDSSGRLSTSFDGEGSNRLVKQMMSRTENVPESEHKRIQFTALAGRMRKASALPQTDTPKMPVPGRRAAKGSIDILLQQNSPPQRTNVTAAGETPPLGKAAYIPPLRNRGSGDGTTTGSGSGPPNGQDQLERRAESNDSPAHTPTQSQIVNREPGVGLGKAAIRHFVNQPGSGVSEGPFPSARQASTEDREGRRMPKEGQKDMRGQYEQDEVTQVFKKPRRSKSALSNVLAGDKPTIQPPPRSLLFPDNRSDTSLPGAIGTSRPASQPGFPSRERQHKSRPTRSDRELLPFDPSSDTQGRDSYAPHRPHKREYTPLSEAQSRGMPVASNSNPTSQPRRFAHPDLFLYTDRTFHGIPEPASHSMRGPDLVSNQRRQLDGPYFENATKRDGIATERAEIREHPPLFSPYPAGSEHEFSRTGWRDDRGVREPSHRSIEAPSQLAHAREDVPSLRRGPYGYESPMYPPYSNERRPRRLMPYVPSATRRAQFEQGRALAFIDSSPMAGGYDGNELRRVEDPPAAAATRTVGPGFPGSFSQHEPQQRRDDLDVRGGFSVTRHHMHDGQANHREAHLTSRIEEMGRMSSHGRVSSDDGRGIPRHGLATTMPRISHSADSFRPRAIPSMGSSVHAPMGTTLEPPIEPHIAPPPDRASAPPMGPLVDARMRSRPTVIGSLRSGPVDEMSRLPSTSHVERGFPREEVPSLAGSAIRSAVIRNSHGRDVMHGGADQRRDPTVYPSTRPPLRTGIPPHPPIGPPASALSRQGEQRPSGSGLNYSRNSTNSVNRSTYELEPNHDDPRSQSFQRRLSYERVSNMPLVARFDNAVTGYVGESAASQMPRLDSARSEEFGIGQRQSNQAEPLPSLRSNPSLRNLLS